MGYLPGWGFRKPILYGTVFPASSLTDFPKLFEVTTDADIAAVLASGGGIAVTLSDGTTTVPFGLYPETTLSAGTVLMRALFSPIASATTGDVLGYIYYDAGQTTTEDKAGTVANGYALFMPMEEDPSGVAPQMFDWVTNSLIGTANGTWSSGQLVPAEVGNGLSFNGTDDTVTFASSALSVWTIRFLTKMNSFSSLMAWFGKASGLDVEISNNNGSGSASNLFSIGRPNFYNPVAVNSTPLSTGVWLDLTTTMDGSSLGSYYLNGASDGSGSYSGLNVTLPAAAALSALDRSSVDGDMDEFSLSSVARSADWIAYAYADEFTNSDTFTLGAQEITNPFVLVAHTAVSGAGPTTGINTTGANLIVICCTGTAGFATPSDSKSNTWTPLTAQTAPGTNSHAQLFYCDNPTVGTGHTFSNTGTTAPAMAVQAWSGASIPSFDQESGNGLLSTGTIQPGSITPPADDFLFVVGLLLGGGSGTASIDSGFTISDQIGASLNFGVMMAYLQQGTAAAENPTCNNGGTSQTEVVMATFKPTGFTPPTTSANANFLFFFGQ